jgi:hypothetical protein
LASLDDCNSKPKSFLIHVWYCGNFYGSDLKKLFYKKYFGWSWFDIYIYLVKAMVEIEVEQKIV